MECGEVPPLRAIMPEKEGGRKEGRRRGEEAKWNEIREIQVCARLVTFSALLDRNLHLLICQKETWEIKSGCLWC